MRELVDELQTLKGTIGKHLDLRVKWQAKQFNIMVDSGAIRNHIILKEYTVNRIRMNHRIALSI